MKPYSNFDSIEASTDRKRLAPGGYVVEIQSVKENEDKQYFECVYDITEGSEKGRFSDDWGQKNPYVHRFIRSYKEAALGMFKAFLIALDESNGTKLVDKVKDKGITPKDFEKKFIGIVLGEEEYVTDRGEIKTRLNVASVKTTEAIRKGDFSIPDKKVMEPTKYKPAPSNQGTPLEGFAEEEDLPF